MCGQAREPAIQPKQGGSVALEKRRFAASAYAAAPILLGVAIAKMGAGPALGLAAVLALIGYFLSSSAESDELAERARDDWQKSYRAFRDHLTSVAAFANSALIGGHAKLQGMSWTDLAERATWPGGLDRALKGWRDRNPNIAKHDDLLLFAAELVDQVDANTISFQLARSHMTDVLGQWVEWSDTKAIQGDIRRRVAEHRLEIVLLAYLEIAHANRMPGRGRAPTAWAQAGTVWPILCKPPIAPESDP